MREIALSKRRVESLTYFTIASLLSRDNACNAVVFPDNSKRLITLPVLIPGYGTSSDFNGKAPRDLKRFSSEVVEKYWMCSSENSPKGSLLDPEKHSTAGTSTRILQPGFKLL